MWHLRKNLIRIYNSYTDFDLRGIYNSITEKKKEEYKNKYSEKWQHKNKWCVNIYNTKSFIFNEYLKKNLNMIYNSLTNFEW
jgi:hypothetical protein